MSPRRTGSTTALLRSILAGMVLGAVKRVVFLCNDRQSKKKFVDSQATQMGLDVMRKNFEQEIQKNEIPLGTILYAGMSEESFYDSVDIVICDEQGALARHGGLFLRCMEEGAAFVLVGIEKMDPYTLMLLNAKGRTLSVHINGFANGESM